MTCNHFMVDSSQSRVVLEIMYHIAEEISMLSLFPNFNNPNPRQNKNIDPVVRGSGLGKCCIVSVEKECPCLGSP